MNCRVETLYLSEIVGAEARAISVSGTRVSIMTKATPEAMAAAPRARSAMGTLANAARRHRSVVRDLQVNYSPSAEYYHCIHILGLPL